MKTLIAPVISLIMYAAFAALMLFFAAMIIASMSRPAQAHELTEIEHRLMLYRQMYYELEFSAEPEELEYLQRKIARLEREAEEFGACPLTINLSEVN